MERFRPMLADHEVTEQQWRVLRVLDETGRMEAGLLAARACVLPPSLSRIIKTLEAQDLIKSSRDRDDGRRTMLALAPKGRRLLESAAQESAAIYATIEGAYGKSAVNDLLDRLEQLQLSLGKVVR